MACQSGLYRATMSGTAPLGLRPRLTPTRAGATSDRLAMTLQKPPPPASVLRLPNVVVRAWNAVPARMPPMSAPATFPMPPTTVSMTRARLMKMMNVSALTLTDALDRSTPPSPAMAAEIMNTESFSLIRFCPSVAAAAGLSFMAVRRRP